MVIGNTCHMHMGTSLVTTDISFYFGHQSFALLFGCFREGIVVSLDDDQPGCGRVENELPWGVPQWCGHLVEYHTQLLQCQNPVTGII